MWFIVALLISLGSGDPMGIGISSKSFDTKAACEVEIDGVVARTKKELETQGATLGPADCIPREKVPPELLEAFDRGRI